MKRHAKTTKLMSFDTSSTKTGWGRYDNGILADWGLIDLSHDRETDHRIAEMILKLLGLLEKEKPDIVVIERPPLVNDPVTLTNLAEIVGTVRGWAVLNHADYVEYIPGSWRKLVAREGEKVPTRRKETKPWSIERAGELFGFIPQDDNEAEGVLIGQARINQLCGKEKTA